MQRSRPRQPGQGQLYHSWINAAPVAGKHCRQHNKIYLLISQQKVLSNSETGNDRALADRGQARIEQPKTNRAWLQVLELAVWLTTKHRKYPSLVVWCLVVL